MHVKQRKGRTRSMERVNPLSNCELGARTSGHVILWGDIQMRSGISPRASKLRACHIDRSAKRSGTDVYDSEGGNVSITFRPTGIKTLAGELAEQKEVAA